MSANATMTDSAPALAPVLTRQQIEEKTRELGQRVSSDYAGRELVLVGVLKGAFIFLADLARCLSIPAQIDFVGVSSYGDGTVSSGTLSFTKHIGLQLAGKDVLLVEDIVDTGLTLARLKEHIAGLGARTVKICAIIDKKERRAVPVEVDYAGFDVPGGFLVGYGLDCGENYRGLPGVYELKF
jgi:hypoxanthine phosphoribosyltransferase